MLSSNNNNFSVWMKILLISVMLMLIGAFLAAGAHAQLNAPPPVSAVKPIVQVGEIGLDQKLNAQLPLDATFLDEQGKTVRLGDYFGKKPVVLALVWYKCPGICGVELEGMAHTFQSQKFGIGDEFDAITVSINPKETPELASAKKDEFIKLVGRTGAQKGWHFLTGQDVQIHRLAAAIGYRYKYDKATDQYVHPAGILLITPQGKVSRYFYGIEYRPRDMQLGLVEASHNKIGTRVDAFLLQCYHYDATTGRYTLAITNILRWAGALTVLVIVLFWLSMMRIERRRAAEDRKTATQRG